MKFTTLRRIVFTLLGALVIPSILTSQEAPDHSQTRPRYSLQILGTLGGTFSQGHGLNNSGSVPGQALVSGDNLPLHAFLWRKGVFTDLGTLGGPDSLVSVANHTVNQRDVVVGYSELSIPDPNGEDICGLGTGLVCLPFVWEKGVMASLPTLGGTNGQANGINNRGQIVGVSETATLDPCSPFFLQIEAVIWQSGQAQELPPLPGDPDGFAGAINDSGEVVGQTGGCAGIHAVLWRHGIPIDLGNLGGVTNNFAFDINNRGQVVGQSDLPGDVLHDPFLWQDGVMVDLGNLPGLPNGQAIGINNRGQIVGFSQDANGDEPTAVAALWENGTVTDLNTLIPVGSPLFLLEAAAINDRGQIAGWGQLADGEYRPFLLTPCENLNQCQISEEAPAESSAQHSFRLSRSRFPARHFPFVAP